MVEWAFIKEKNNDGPVVEGQSVFSHSNQRAMETWLVYMRED